VGQNRPKVMREKHGEGSGQKANFQKLQGSLNLGGGKNAGNGHRVRQTQSVSRYTFSLGGVKKSVGKKKGGHERLRGTSVQCQVRKGPLGGEKKGRFEKKGRKPAGHEDSTRKNTKQEAAASRKKAALRKKRALLHETQPWCKWEPTAPPSRPEGMKKDQGDKRRFRNGNRPGPLMKEGSTGSRGGTIILGTPGAAVWGENCNHGRERSRNFQRGKKGETIEVQRFLKNGPSRKKHRKGEKGRLL